MTTGRRGLVVILSEAKDLLVLAQSEQHILRFARMKDPAPDVRYPSPERQRRPRTHSGSA